MRASNESEPIVDCVGISLPFEIASGATALAHVDLECTGDETRGEVKLDGTWNHCPEITAYTAAFGSPATATATTSSAIYHCAVAGAATITLTVSDSDASLRPERSARLLPRNGSGRDLLRHSERCLQGRAPARPPHERCCGRRVELRL